MTNRCARVILTLCIALLPALGAAASRQVDEKLFEKDAVKKHVEKEAPVRGRTVSVRSAVSNMVVEPGTGDQVQVSADLRFWSSDDEMMATVRDEFDVEIAESGSRLEITVELPRRSEKGFFSRLFPDRSVRYSIDLWVKVPASVPVEIGNSYGAVTARGLDGPLQIANTSGDITVEHAGGPVVLDGRYGNVQVSDISGDLRAATSSGAITASRLGGSAVIGSSYGDVQVESVSGDLTVSTSSGNVTAAGVKRNAQLTTSYGEARAERIDGNLVIEAQSGESHVSGVTGSLRVAGSYGDVIVEHVGGPAEITTATGSVTASDIKGDLSIRCSYGNARVRDVDGRLRVTASSTTVQAESIRGPVDVETTYGSVDLNGITGAITVVNQSGGVTVRGLSGAALGAEHRVQTSYADIDFTWPAAQSVSFSLESTYGRVESRIPGTLRESGSRKILEGSQGGSKARVTLVSQSGSVLLRSE